MHHILISILSVMHVGLLRSQARGIYFRSTQDAVPSEEPFLKAPSLREMMEGVWEDLGQGVDNSFLSASALNLFGSSRPPLAIASCMLRYSL